MSERILKLVGLIAVLVPIGLYAVEAVKSQVFVDHAGRSVGDSGGVICERCGDYATIDADGLVGCPKCGHETSLQAMMQRSQGSSNAHIDIRGSVQTPPQ